MELSRIRLKERIERERETIRARFNLVINLRKYSVELPSKSFLIQTRKACEPAHVA